MVMRVLLSVLLLGLVAVGTPAPAAAEVRYVVPFLAVMIPPEIADGVFDLFVDTLNREGEARGLEFVILKTPAAEIDPDWLAGQTYITGELFGYVRDSGCCSTALGLKARAEIHRPGSAPAVRIAFPYEAFYDHDASSHEAERQRLIAATAGALAAQVLAALPPS